MVHFSKNCYCQNIQSVNFVFKFLYLHLENTKNTQFKFIILLCNTMNVRMLYITHQVKLYISYYVIPKMYGVWLTS